MSKTVQHVVQCSTCLHYWQMLQLQHQDYVYTLAPYLKLSVLKHLEVVDLSADPDVVPVVYR